MSNFHRVTQYGSKIRHPTVTGVTCDTARCQLWQTPTGENSERMGIIFNILNASLMGEYIGALSNAPNLFVGSFWHSLAFLSSLFLFIAGSISNVWHDEVLLKLWKTWNTVRGMSWAGDTTKFHMGGCIVSSCTFINLISHLILCFDYLLYRFPNYLSEWYVILLTTIFYLGSLFQPLF